MMPPQTSVRKHNDTGKICEVANISRHKWASMSRCGGGNPQIVVADRPPFSSRLSTETTPNPRRFRIDFKKFEVSQESHHGTSTRIVIPLAQFCCCDHTDADRCIAALGKKFRSAPRHSTLDLAFKIDEECRVRNHDSLRGLRRARGSF